MDSNKKSPKDDLSIFIELKETPRDDLTQVLSTSALKQVHAEAQKFTGTRRSSPLTRFLLVLLFLALAAFASVHLGGVSFAVETERVNVDALKQKYWEKGDEAELRVVQNRQYPKALRFELAPMGALIVTDPFLTVRAVGGMVGFHISDYFQISLMGWKAFTTSSQALLAIQSTAMTTANTNPQQWFAGGGLEFSPIYGKISLFGKVIFHYDLHFSGGSGLMATDNGRYLSFYLGIGQTFYLNRYLGLRVDYRNVGYQEAVIQRADLATYGQFLYNQIRLNDVFTLGFSLIL